MLLNQFLFLSSHIFFFIDMSVSLALFPYWVAVMFSVPAFNVLTYMIILYVLESAVLLVYTIFDDFYVDIYIFSLLCASSILVVMIS